MGIKDDLNIWITDIDRASPNEPVLIGLAFDGELGFGSGDQREYEGKIFLISDAGRFEILGSISSIHISGKGSVWSFSGGDLPPPPFLLTSDSRVIDTQSGKIELAPTHDAEKVFARDGDAYYPIFADSFIGILHHSPNSDFLVRFRLEDRSKPSIERLTFSEWEIEAGSAAIR